MFIALVLDCLFGLFFGWVDGIECWMFVGRVVIILIVAMFLVWLGLSLVVYLWYVVVVYFYVALFLWVCVQFVLVSYGFVACLIWFVSFECLSVWLVCWCWYLFSLLGGLRVGFVDLVWSLWLVMLLFLFVSLMACIFVYFGVFAWLCIFDFWLCWLIVFRLVVRVWVLWLIVLC